ncbi:MAG: flavin-dependent dehydrogenase [Verrucomicrobiales bacterium]|jgi:flavin-dependent dehydrogenase
MKLRFLSLVFFPFVGILQAADSVVESAREIPVAYDVDVVVVGGGVGAITAAVEAAEQGASVFLAAPRPYLGEDVAGTLRLWLEDGEEPETPLERALFERKNPGMGFPNRLAFSYEPDQTPNKIHPDSKLSILTDSKWANAATDSVQFDADTTIVADLGKMARLKELHLIAFRRAGEFEVGEIEVWTSPNGKLWRDLGKIEEAETGSSGGGDAEAQFSIEVKQPCRYVKVLVKKAAEAERILLGELLLIEDADTVAAPVQTRIPATPMQVKIALDDALLAAGVQYLYGCATTDILVDADGQPAGIVIANRAGRQAVRAKVVIDATARATAARAAGAEFEDYPSGPQTFQRIVAGGEAKNPENAKVETANVKFYSREGEHDVHVYQLQIPMPDASAASFGRAEVLAREQTFDAELVDESDTLFQIPPDPMKARATANAVDHETLDLAALQPVSIDRFYVLGGCAGVSRPAAAELVRPLTQMRIGKRVGAAAAQLAAATPKIESAVVLVKPAGESKNPGDVHEFLNGARPTQSGLPTVKSPARILPVLGEYDVVIAGGGTGGAPAGIGAGRAGGKALVIEFQDHLGGVGTLGLIASYYHGYRKGFTLEVDAGVAEIGGPKRKGGWNPVTKREWWRRAVVEAGSDIWFSTLACGAWVENGVVKGVIVATPQGRGVVLAKTVVDSTGNSDIAAAAGADTITTSAEHVAMQGTGLSPRALGTGYTNTDYSFADESDPVDQWRMIVAARQKYRNSYDVSSFIDTRERRRILGEAFITPMDVINGQTWRDTISMHQSNFDTHGYTVHPIFLIDFPDKKSMTAAVPYRALLPRNVEGVIVTGLGMSAHRDSMPILRMQACIQNQGYAAGYAAATVAEQGIPPRSLDIRTLQKHLVEIGSLPAEVLEHTDSELPPDDQIKAAVKSVVQDYRGLAILVENSEKAIPLLREEYKLTESADHRLIYANILGMQGDPTGVQELIAAVESQDWDEGWNFRGMGQFGGSISRLDSHIIALGQSGSAEGLPAILAKVAQLDSTKEFSHHRAVAMALEAQRTPAAAEALAALLQREKMTGYAIADIAESNRQEQRSEPLREIILARALFRCGDHEGLAVEILRAYEQDLRGLFAQHAQAVLNEK